MLTAFKVILFIILLISVMGLIGSKENNERIHLSSLGIACISALTVLFSLM